MFLVMEPLDIPMCYLLHGLGVKLVNITGGIFEERSHVGDYFMSQEEVAKALNMTRAEVQHTEYTALKKLKRAAKLRRYVGAKEN